MKPEARRVRILAFTAPWCQPCQQQKPQIERLRQAGWDIRSVSPGDAAWQAYQPSLLPTYVVLYRGHAIAAHSAADLTEFLSTLNTEH